MPVDDVRELIRDMFFHFIFLLMGATSFVTVLTLFVHIGTSTELLKDSIVCVLYFTGSVSLSLYVWFRVFRYFSTTYNRVFRRNYY